MSVPRQSLGTCASLSLKPGAKAGSAILNPDTGRIVYSVNLVCTPTRNSRAAGAS